MKSIDKFNKDKLKTTLLIIFVLFNLFLSLKIIIERKGNSIFLKKSAESTLLTKTSQINGYIYENSHVLIDSLDNSISPILCLYISQLHCRPCVDSLLILFKKFCSKNPVIKYSILANYNTINELTLFKRMHNISNSDLFFNVKNNGSFIFQTSSPVVFIYNPLVSRAELVFFPNKLDIKQTWEYLEVVKQRYGFAP